MYLIGATECDLMTHEESLMIMTIIQTIKEQLGIVYAADKE